MKNILIINPWSGKIGPNTFIDGFVKASLASCNDVTMIYPYRDALSMSLEKMGCKIYYLRILKLNHISNKFFKVFYRALIELLLLFIFPFYLTKKRFDLCFVNTEMFSFSLLPVSGITKVAIVVHSLSFSTNGVSKVLFKLQQLAVTNYIAVSNAVKESLKAKNVNKPICMVHNGINLDCFPQDNKTESSAVIEILSVIHPVPHKGAHFLIEVIKLVISEVKNVHFSIVGWDNISRDEPYKMMIEHRVETAHLQEYLSFINCTDDINKEYLKSDILVHPSESESFGYVIAECMALNLPVVAFEVGGIPEVVENNQSGFLITPYDVDQMAKRLLLLIESEDLRTKFGKRGRKIIEEKFQLESNINQILQFLGISNT